MRTLSVALVIMLGSTSLHADVVTPPPTREQTVEVQDPGAQRKRVALGLAIGGGVLLVASAGVAIGASSAYDKCVDDNAMVTPGAPGCPYNTVVDATDYANRQQEIARWVGTPLFALGTIALGTALYLRLTVPEKRRVVRVGVTPQVSHSSVGVVFDGSF